MKRATTLALLCTLAASCGKKDESETQATAKPADQPAVTCDKGQVAEGDKCVAVVTPEKVAAVGKEVSKLEELEAQLERIELLTAPIEVLNAVRQLEVWQTAAKTSEKFKHVDDMVITLKKASDELKAFSQQLDASKAKLRDLGTTLDQIYQGSGAADTMAEARAKVSAEVKAAIDPLQEQVVAAMQVIEPAFVELEKLGDVFAGVCALGAMSGGGAELEKLCETGKDAFDKALEYLKANKDAPKTLLTDLASRLEAELELLVTAEARKLLEDAEKIGQDLAGEADQP